jgi:signal transduction histidine kinase
MRNAGGVRLRRTVRLRLTAFYGGLFCACGAGLLAITYLLVRHFSAHVQQLTHLGPISSARSAGGPEVRLPPLPSLVRLQARAQAALVNQHNSDLHQLLVWSLVALAVMTAVAIALGWLVAGRVLAPLRTMTATTRRISQDNLHQRLALPGARDELRELGDTIDGLLARLEAAFASQRRFVANAAHELRTPLARIRTALDVAVGKPGSVSPQVTALDRKIREGLGRADQLVDGFLELGRAEHGELPDRAAVALDQVIVAVVAERQPELAAKRITIVQRLSATTVSGSPTLLSRMVDNLIDNGVRHNITDGWLRIELRDQPDRARLTIESGGPTLDPSQVRELAQPFRRLGAERTGSDRGAGLGLSIVAAIAAAHTGTLQLDAREQGGLRVAIDLPRDRSINGTGAAP